MRAAWCVALLVGLGACSVSWDAPLASVSTLVPTRPPKASLPLDLGVRCPGAEATCDPHVRLTQLTGASCFSSNTDSLWGLDLRDADERIEAMGGPGRWLEEGRIFIGDRDEAIAAFGGEYHDGLPRNYLILVDPDDGIPYAQQLLGQETPGGLPAWVAGDQIRICGDNWD